MLVIDHVHRAVGNQDRVRCSEAFLYPPGEVHPLFDQDNRIGAGFLGSSQQFHNEGGIPGSAVIHFLIEPGQVVRRVFRFHAQRLPEPEFAQRVSISAFCSVVTAFVRVRLAQSRRWWAVNPAV